MGVTLAIARMMTIRNALLRGIYAALALAFLITLYLTVSRGGIGALGVGMIVLLLLTEKRLQLIVNLLLLAVPGAWLVWRVQSLHNFFEARISDQHKLVLGTAFRNDLIVALVVAFALQAAYAFLTNRYELPRYELPTIGRRGLAALFFGATVLVIGAGAFLLASKYGGIGQAYETIVSNPNQTKNATQRLASLNPGYREDYWKVAWEAWKEHPLTGTGAGTFKYTWLENRPNTQSVQQVHNLYLEQGTETGIFAFLALVGFVVTLVGYSARGAWRARGERRLLLAGLISTLVVYLLSSFLEWHWYIPGSTLFFFFLAAITLKFALKEDWDVPETAVSESPAVKQP
jgi:O-antigen ligase